MPRVGGAGGGKLGMDAVDHHRAEVVAAGAQAAGEKEGVGDALLSRTGHQDEDGAG